MACRRIGDPLSDPMLTRFTDANMRHQGEINLIAYNLNSYKHNWTEEGLHYNDVIMGAMASQITSLTIVYSTIYSGADQRKHQSSTWLAFVRGIHRWPVNSPHKRPVMRKMFPFDDVIMWAVNELLHKTDEVLNSHALVNKYRHTVQSRQLSLYFPGWGIEIYLMKLCFIF